MNNDFICNCGNKYDLNYLYDINYANVKFTTPCFKCGYYFNIQNAYEFINIFKLGNDNDYVCYMYENYIPYNYFRVVVLTGFSQLFVENYKNYLSLNERKILLDKVIDNVYFM